MGERNQGDFGPGKDVALLDSDNTCLAQTIGM